MLVSKMYNKNGKNGTLVFIYKIRAYFHTQKVFRFGQSCFFKVKIKVLFSILIDFMLSEVFSLMHENEHE